MMRRVLAVSVLVLTGATASAQQTFESVGERALGMGGAFVAVADDATAAFWNPAGLVGGAPVGMTIGWYRYQFGNRNGAAGPGPLKRDGTFTSLGTWPLGISYGKFQTAGLWASKAGPTEAQSLRVNHYGVTLLQSVIQGLVVGGTFKYLRGDVVTAPLVSGTVKDVFKGLEELKGERNGAFDVDLGVMATSPRVRIGLTVKNLRSPTFGNLANSTITLQRHARLGFAVLPANGVTLAMDVDLDTVDLRGDLRRMLAVGGEARLGPRLAVRSGLRWNLEQFEVQRLIGAVGLSARVRSGLWIDAHYAQGRLDEEREFGAAMRAGF